MAKHKIKARLYENALTPDPNDLTARVVSETSLTVKDVCNSAATRGGADISASSMRHATDLFFKEMGYLLCDGFSINTGYFTAAPCIKGVFNNPKETFNPNKHSLIFQFIQGENMRKAIAEIEVEMLGMAETKLEISQVTDMKSGSVNEVMTPNYNLKIVGNRLKIAGDHPDVGVRLTYVANPDIFYDVDPSDLVVNNPSELMIIIPDVQHGGDYQLQVTTQYGVSKLLKEPRTVIFDKTLRT